MNYRCHIEMWESKSINISEYHLMHSINLELWVRERKTGALLSLHRYFTVTFTQVRAVNPRHKCNFSSKQLTERIKINVARLLAQKRSTAWVLS